MPNESQTALITGGTSGIGLATANIAQAPAGRSATGDEIAESIIFLAPDRASFIYGAKLAVNGGRTAV
jgi:NAD(P)-dependent dehydrogenase (short-subunit alcohol dehydrogenase family)